ncbi:3-alpha-hydroxysteroid dehydrogenase [Croceicoccus estronivorus]|uniref:SDR family oxidoreductase n=1 Tax=Croceicoccus estronivorus TaxID=1172626 RepID=UPI000835ADCB|nr:SDR family oxidoreductase [Croceicoccus estronivorus]OCC23746.1 3-alpha-hydroxysteroid dehydrogenase [Croceicoccus estronivorus]
MSLLKSKIALVSGGAMGMGASHARAIVAEGGKVVIGDVSDEAGRALAAELGDDAVYVHLDVTNPADWAAAVETAVTTFGGLNVLVNNAGIINVGALGSYTVEDWNKIIAVNLTGVFLGMSAAVDALKKSAPSSIVNISSIAGTQAVAGFHGYVASKFGVRGITKSAALELAPHNVRVNSVHPGAIRTPMTAGLPDSVAHNAMNRFGKPEEISNLVVYLASDLSSLSTGSEFAADGGEGAGAVRPLAEQLEAVT